MPNGPASAINIGQGRLALVPYSTAMPLAEARAHRGDPSMAMKVVVERCGLSNREPWRWRIVEGEQIIGASDGGFRGAEDAYHAGRQMMLKVTK